MNQIIPACVTYSDCNFILQKTIEADPFMMETVRTVIKCASDVLKLFLVIRTRTVTGNASCVDVLRLHFRKLWNQKWVPEMIYIMLIALSCSPSSTSQSICVPKFQCITVIP